MQPLHHIKHHRRGLQGLHFVVYVSTGLEKVKISHQPCRIAQRIAFGIFLDKERGGTGIYRWSSQKIEDGYADGHGQ